MRLEMLKLCYIHQISMGNEILANVECWSSLPFDFVSRSPLMTDRFVCATTEATETVCLRNYSTKHADAELLGYTKIWEAARATSAAPTFFDDITIGPSQQRFQDGAFGANCPVKYVWREASAVWSSKPLEEQLGCLLSIGTGVVSQKVLNSNLSNIAATLKNIALGADRAARDFVEDHQDIVNDGRYLRLNVIHGLDNIALGDAGKRGEIVAFTKSYTQDSNVQAQVKRCVKNAENSRTLTRFACRKLLTHILAMITVFPPYENSQHVRQCNVTRHSVLNAIEQGFNSSSTDVVPIVLLHGLPGSGKTRVAQDVLEHHVSSERFAFWFDASSQSSLDASFFRFMEQSRLVSAAPGSSVQAGQVRQKVTRFISNFESPWTLVFDNYDLAEAPDGYDISSYIPQCGLGRIVITSRNRAVSQAMLSPCLPIALDSMGIDESVELFKTSAGLIPEISLSDEELTLIHEVTSDLLGGLPLAIAQAGSYVRLVKRKNSMPEKLQQYVDVYRHHEEIILRGQSAKFVQEYRKSILSTFRMSFETIRENNSSAASLLLLCSFFHYNGISVKWFQRACAARHRFLKNGVDLSEEQYQWFDRLIKPAYYGTWDSALLDECLDLLSDYALIQQSGDGQTFNIHPLVHTWSLAYQDLDATGTTEPQAKLAISILVESYEDAADAVGPAFVDTRLNLHLHLDRWVHVADSKTKLTTNVISNTISGYTLGRLSNLFDSPTLSPEHHASDTCMRLRILSLSQTLKFDRFASKHVLEALSNAAVWAPDTFAVDRTRIVKLVTVVEGVLDAAEQKGVHIDGKYLLQGLIPAWKATVLRREINRKPILETGLDIVEQLGDDLPRAKKLQLKYIYLIMLFREDIETSQKEDVAGRMNQVYLESCTLLG